MTKPKLFEHLRNARKVRELHKKLTSEHKALEEELDILEGYSSIVANESSYQQEKQQVERYANTTFSQVVRFLIEDLEMPPDVVRSSCCRSTAEAQKRRRVVLTSSK